jgi:hypothetical protein
MPDYQKGKIYKITSGDLIYIGSTCEPTLAKRLANHVKNFKVFQTGKGGSNVSSYQLIETGTYEITLVELFPCGSKDELTARERFHIENTACVNKRIPGRTKKEYHIDNQEKHNVYTKKYYIDNKVKIKDRQGSKYTCNCGLVCRLDSKSKHERSKKHLDFMRNFLERG